MRIPIADGRYSCCRLNRNPVQICTARTVRLFKQEALLPGLLPENNIPTLRLRTVRLPVIQTLDGVYFQTATLIEYFWMGLGKTGSYYSAPNRILNRSTRNRMLLAGLLTEWPLP